MMEKTWKQEREEFKKAVEKLVGDYRKSGMLGHSYGWGDFRRDLGKVFEKYLPTEIPENAKITQGKLQL